MTCPHGVCYGLKWLLRQEGPRDHVDMLMNLVAVPNVVITDIANMVAAHARKRGFDVFSPFHGRVAESTEEKIRKAEIGDLQVDWPWFPNGNNEEPAECGVREGDHQLTRNPTTGCSDHYSLLDPFHEKNSTGPADRLRRVGCVKQLAGRVNLETAEQLSNRRNRDNYFTTSLSRHFH